MIFLDQPLLSPKRLCNAVRFYLFFVLSGLDLGLWWCLRFYRRESARVRHEGEEYQPPKFVWRGPDANLLH